MKILSNFDNIYWIFIIIYVNNIIGNDSSRTSGIKELINYIKVHSRKYQVCLLMGNDMNIKLNDILYEIEGNFPTRSINFNTINDIKLRMTFHGNTRRTTLFIVIAPLKFSSKMVGNLSAFFNHLSVMRMRQKCLIILSSTIEKGLSTNAILLKMWRMSKMLDLTIFELHQVVVNVNRFISRIRVRATLKHYNPFTNKYTKEKNITALSEWFPDKLHNLYQYPIRVGFLNQYASRSNGKIDSIDEVNAYILQDFAKVLNFRVDLVFTDRDNFDEFRDEKDIYKYMEANRIDMLPDFHLYGNPLDYKYFQASRPLENIKIFAFIRIKTRQELTLLVKQFFYMIIIFVILIIILSTLSKILKLDHRFWNPITLIQIFSGNSLNHQPEKIVDRIIFGSLILTHGVYSAKIFESLVNIGELINLEEPLESLEDLNNSNLIPVMTNYTRNIIFDSSDEHVLSLLNRTNFVNENDVCYKKVTNLRNITCIVATNGSRIDKILSVRFFDSFRKPSIKALDFYLAEKWMFWSHKSGSPFKEKFDQLMIKLVDFGIYRKYMEFRLKTNYENKEQSEKRDKQSIKQKGLFYYLLIIGYCISFLVFIIEMLFKCGK